MRKWEKNWKREPEKSDQNGENSWKYKKKRIREKNINIEQSVWLLIPGTAVIIGHIVDKQWMQDRLLNYLQNKTTETEPRKGR